MWDARYSLYTLREGQRIVVAHSVSKHDVRNIVRAWPDAQWEVLCGDEQWSMVGSTQDVLRRLASGPYK
jgi:hypothetical protein